MIEFGSEKMEVEAEWESGFGKWSKEMEEVEREGGENSREKNGEKIVEWWNGERK